MLNSSEKSYFLALQALKSKNYSTAADYFDRAVDHFVDNQEFTLLRETTRLLIAVKEELAATELKKDVSIS